MHAWAFILSFWKKDDNINDKKDIFSVFHEYCRLITASMSKQQSAFYMLHYLEGWSWKTFSITCLPPTPNKDSLPSLFLTRHKAETRSSQSRSLWTRTFQRQTEFWGNTGIRQHEPIRAESNYFLCKITVDIKSWSAMKLVYWRRVQNQRKDKFRIQEYFVGWEGVREDFKIIHILKIKMIPGWYHPL